MMTNHDRIPDAERVTTKQLIEVLLVLGYTRQDLLMLGGFTEDELGMARPRTRPVAVAA